MKKVKFMLLSLALVAVVGGAVAFKVKTNTHFCTTLAHKVGDVSTCIVDDVDLNCPNLTTAVTTAGGNSPDFYCTTPTNGDPLDPCGQVCETTTRKTIIGD